MTEKTGGMFPRGLEVVCGAIIENGAGEILLAKSPKWKNKWVTPGGHVEPGEGLADAIVREGKEETGLDLKPVGIVSWGELINSNDFYRPAHFIFFDFYCKVFGGRLSLEKRELDDAKWLKPAEAFELELAESYDKTLKDFMAYKEGNRV